MPDFAYPVKVENNALADLEAAMKADNGPAMVNALVRYGLAKTSVSADSVPVVLGKINKVESQTGNAVVKSLLNLLQARIYTSVYRDDAYRIGRRANTGAGADGDYTVWSKAQFAEKVTSLVNEAVAAREALLATPLDAYSAGLVFNRDMLTFYPTLYDFVANQSIECLLTFDGMQSTLNPRVLFRPLDSSLYPASRGSMTGEILRLYASLIEGRDDTPAGIVALGKEIEFASERLFEVPALNVTFPGEEYEQVSQLFDALKLAYGEHAASPYAIELLTEVEPATLSGSQKKELYSILNSFIEANPGYFNMNAVKNLRAQLIRKQVNAQTPTQVAKGGEAVVRLSVDNVKKVTLKLYDVTSIVASADDSYCKLPASRPTPVASVDVSFDDSVPFSASRSVAVKVPEYGKYVVEPMFEGEEKSNSFPVIACSNLSAGVFSGVGESAAVVVDAVTGEPCRGVSMFYKPWNRKSPGETLPTLTDADGFVKIDQSKPGTLRPIADSDRYALGVNYYSVSESRSTDRLDGEIFTSLGLYHPGDVVDFSFIAYTTGGVAPRVETGKSLTVGLRDANYVEVSKVTLTTDATGRAQGSFTLPSEGLTGTFTLTLTDGDKRTVATRSFMVSDYKLPTFEVNVDKVSRPASIADSAVVSGSARTYAGFPVGDAQVKLQLSVRTGLWFRSATSPVFYETQTETAPDGTFRIVIPSQALASSPAPEGYFLATVSVTSPDGETHETTTGFNMGKPLVLSANVPALFVPGETKATVEATEFSGGNETIKLNCEIFAVDEPLGVDGTPSYRKVTETQCESGDVASLFKTLSAGTYTARFAPVDSAKADAVIVDRVVVYRKDNKACPVNALLWLPKSEGVADAQGECAITFGTAVDGARVLMVMSDMDGHIVWKKWLSPTKGMVTFKAALPDKDKSARIYLRVVKNLMSESASFTINPASSLRSITIKTETFRDKVTPGNLETLKFKVSGMNGADVQSAVILSMTNKAIDVLAPNSMSFIPRRDVLRGISIDGLYFGSNGVNLWSAFRNLEAVDLAEPAFELYGRSFSSSSAMVMNRSMKLSASSVRIRGTAKVETEEAADEAEMVVEEVMMPAYASADNGASAGAVTTDGAAEPTAETDDYNYRPSEIPMAFFRPMLNTKADGSLEVTYTVPDANTTWVLRSLAYNNELLTSSGSVEIVASKPLMVSANAPRFLRTGDKVELLASVMNMTDTALCAQSVGEILDASTMQVLATTESADMLDAKGRSVIGMRFEVPATVSALVFRVRSGNASFSDGEQVFIPVLPSVQDVVESRMFYIAPSQEQFTMPLDSVGNGRAWLKFTENPAWEVVSALPGLREGTINSSLDAAGALFSAAVADGLMRDYPEIARTLRRWRDNPADSALVSELEKNDVLKSVLLSSTPWVSDALNQTERMQRLVLLLDKRNTSKVIEKAVAALSNTSVSGGGWSWTTQYPELSEWCTVMILDMLGDLNRLGWLPDNKNLASMTSSAVACLDRITAARYAKSPKGDYTLYCYTRAKFPEVKQSTAAAKVTRVTVQRIIGAWKDHSPVVKAADAIVLSANGYTATARSILKSLRELATVTPEKGMWWQQLENTTYRSLDKVGCTAIILDAFAQVEPQSADVEKIRQWLILQKTNTDWGNAVITSQVISSILTSGRPVAVNTAGTAIRVGETLIEPSAEYATGSFTEPITQLLKEPTTLTIDRRADYPSFGAVVTMRTAEMNDIKAVACSELLVDKNLSVFNGEMWVQSDSFSVGDRVKVTLTLKADTDMDYVVVEDKRAATFEPVEQLPRPVWSEGLCFYRENRDSQTNLFIRHLPRGTYVLTYELFVTQAGSFSSGVAGVQSQYNPAIAAHSAGAAITVK